MLGDSCGSAQDIARSPQHAHMPRKRVMEASNPAHKETQKPRNTETQTQRDGTKISRNTESTEESSKLNVLSALCFGGTHSKSLCFYVFMFLCFYVSMFHFLCLSKLIWWYKVDKFGGKEGLPCVNRVFGSETDQCNKTEEMSASSCTP